MLARSSISLLVSGPRQNLPDTAATALALIEELTDSRWASVVEHGRPLSRL